MLESEYVLSFLKYLPLSPLNATACKVMSRGRRFAAAVSDKKAECDYCAYASMKLTIKSLFDQNKS